MVGQGDENPGASADSVSSSPAVIVLFCRQYDIIKDNDSNNNKEKAKPSSEQSTPERQTGGLLRKVSTLVPPES